MDVQKACNILDITLEDDILETTLIKQYRKMSLLYHPDKNNSPDSIQKFQEIHDSYEYLGKYLGYIDEDYYLDECVVHTTAFTSWNFVAYKDKVMGFLNVTLGDDIMRQIQDRLLNNLLKNEKINTYMDHEKIMKVYSFLLLNKDRYNISDEFLLSLATIINQLH